MTGKELFDFYTAFRDYSGNAADEYAQTLETAFMLFRDDVFTALENAEPKAQKIKLGYPIPEEDGPSTPNRLIIV